MTVVCGLLPSSGSCPVGVSPPAAWLHNHVDGFAGALPSNLDAAQQAKLQPDGAACLILHRGSLHQYMLSDAGVAAVQDAESQSVVFRPSYGLDPASLWTAVSVVPEALFVKAVDLIPVRRFAWPLCACQER